MVGEAGDGQHAIDLVRVFRTDMVLMDLIMPGIDGMTTTKRLHAQFPEVRVVILSSVDEEVAIVAAVRAGLLPTCERARELEVLQLLANGLANNEIARRLRISERTVKSHLGRILDRFCLESRTQAAMFAMRVGLVRQEAVKKFWPPIWLRSAS